MLTRSIVIFGVSLVFVLGEIISIRISEKKRNINEIYETHKGYAIILGIILVIASVLFLIIKFSDKNPATEYDMLIDIILGGVGLFYFLFLLMLNRWFLRMNDEFIEYRAYLGPTKHINLKDLTSVQADKVGNLSFYVGDKRIIKLNKDNIIGFDIEQHLLANDITIKRDCDINHFITKIPIVANVIVAVLFLVGIIGSGILIFPINIKHYGIQFLIGWIILIIICVGSLVSNVYSKKEFLYDRVIYKRVFLRDIVIMYNNIDYIKRYRNGNKESYQFYDKNRKMIEVFTSDTNSDLVIQLIERKKWKIK